MMSVRGSRPKMASDTVTEPDCLPSSVVIFSSISRAFPGFGGRVGLGLGCRCGRVFGELELAGFRHTVRQLLLHRVTYRDPAAFDAWHRALDQNETALDVGL